jgi:tetratricopeptide (TPR) repeat protein
LFTNDISCVDTVHAEFRADHAHDRLEEAIDDAMTVNKAVSQRVHLLYRDAQGKELLTLALPPWEITTEDKYAREKAALPAQDAQALDQALDLIAGAAKVLSDDDLAGPDKARIAKAFYHESIKAFPTADAHAYLGWHYYLDGELDQAALECERAIELDPTFGNTYNDLALIRVQQGFDQEAVELFEKAKTAPRYDMRHFPSLNLAALHLEKDRVKPALHEYIQALHWMDDESAVPIRNTVADIATFIVTMDDKLRAAG